MIYEETGTHPCPICDSEIGARFADGCLAGYCYRGVVGAWDFRTGRDGVRYPAPIPCTPEQRDAVDHWINSREVAA